MQEPAHTKPGRRRQRRWFPLVAGVVVFAGLTASGLIMARGGDGARSTASSDRIGLPRPTGLEGWVPLAASTLRGRSHHSQVWTGKEAIVWGGFRVEPDGKGEVLADGAAYDPNANKWRRIAMGPLASRQSHFGAWTGREMLIWGGPSPEVLPESQVAVDHNGGALYDPAADTWRQIPASPLSPRSETAVALAAGRLVVWGGRDGRAPNEPGLADGAAYDLGTNLWTVLPAAPLPGRIRPVVTTVADEVLIWSGIRIEPGGDRRTDGAVYNPLTDSWRKIADAPRPSTCFEDRCLGASIGRSAIFINARLTYSPDTDSWKDMPDCAAAREYNSGQSIISTGDGLIAWGGKSLHGERLPGAAYHLDTNRWNEIAEPPFPSRLFHRVVWTGDYMIMWGGISGAEGEQTTYHNDGAAYAPGDRDLSTARDCPPAPPPPPVD